MENPKIDDRYKLLNREASLVSGLLSSGLTDLKKISDGDGYYYLAFYSLSLGLERLLKLLLLASHPGISVRRFSHGIKELLTEVHIAFPDDSIEESIIIFLNDFGAKDRYIIPDILSSQDVSQLGKEPISRFYTEVLQKVAAKHKIRNLFIPPADFPAMSFFAVEDFSEIEDFQTVVVRKQIIDHASKYLAMYMGRILRCVVDEIYKVDQINGNPAFNEHFVGIHQNDEYFKTRKTFTK